MNVSTLLSRIPFETSGLPSHLDQHTVQEKPTLLLEAEAQTTCEGPYEGAHQQLPFGQFLRQTTYAAIHLGLVSFQAAPFEHMLLSQVAKLRKATIFFCAAEAHRPGRPACQDSG